MEARYDRTKVERAQIPDKYALGLASVTPHICLLCDKYYTCSLCTHSPSPLAMEGKNLRTTFQQIEIRSALGNSSRKFISIPSHQAAGQFAAS